MKSSKSDLRAIQKEKLVSEIKEIIRSHKNIVISGEVGVGKITNTLEALQEADNVYYIGNPVDYVGKPRPKGYDKYIDYITSLKRNMRVITEERHILSCDVSSMAAEEAVLVIDEIYGRSAEQYKKISEILGTEKVKVLLIAGCIKNVGRIIEKFDAIVMLLSDGTLLLDPEFMKKICLILGSDPFGRQAGLFP